MRELFYTLTNGPSQNAYRYVQQLVLIRQAGLPDARVGCGKPAQGNVLTQSFERGSWWWALPTGLDLIASFIVPKLYLFDFPFCRNCGPDNFSLRPVRLGSKLAIFSGASGAFLDLLPPITPELATQINRGWLQ